MDNLYQSCPAKTNDTRYLTDSVGAHTRDSYVRATYQVNNSFDYSTLLTNSGDKLTKHIFKTIVESNSEGSCIPTETPIGVTINKPTKTYAQLCNEFKLQIK